MSTLKVDTYLTRGGASEIAIDKLKGVTAAGSMLVVGEGGTNTTNLQQGLCKSWCHLRGTSTPTPQDSFNIGSVTDTATGRKTLNFSSNFGNGNYTCSGMAGNDGTTASVIAQMVDATPTTSAFAYRNVLDGGTARDDTNELLTLHGDLA